MSVFRGGIPLLTVSFSKKEQNERCQVTEVCQTLLMVSVTYGHGLIQGGRIRVFPSQAIFKDVVDKYNLS